MKQMISHLKIAWYGSLLLLVLVSLVLCLCNAKSVSSVSIRLNEGVEEVRDKVIPFVNDKDDRLPDYKLSYNVDGRWKTVGTTMNTSADQWLEYKISDPPNATLVQSLRVTEVDKAFDDVLEEVQLVDTQTSGKIFEYRVETIFSVKSGMAWFATSSLGKAILGGIFLAILLVVLSTLDF